ncbi:hypothetical protein LAZ67_3000928, partial [Cordylochernes scorpioides]
MVIGLKRAGWSIRQITADTHLGASTVHRLWRRWLEQGNVAIYRNVGATRVTSARVDWRILRQAVAAPQATCTAILQHVQDTLDHSLSTRTISRRLVANGLHSCRPLRRLPLTPPNRRQRLEWCRARSTWMTEWHRVVFSDESRFCLSSDSRRVRVWRRRGERSNPAAIVERPTVRQRGIMVWGAIAYDSRIVETRSGKMQDPAQERIKAEESAKPQPGATIGRDASSDPVVLNPNIDIPKYDGTEDPRPWIESLEEIGFLYHWADYIISRYAAMNMIGSAKTWLNLHKVSFTSWENFKSRLIEDFASDANKEEMRMRLNRIQQWNEPAIRFAEDILVLCNKVDPQMEEETKINWVIGGLKKEYSFALHLNPPKNTNELLEICKKLDLFEKNYQERAEKSKALYNGQRSPRPHHQEQWKNATSFRRPYQNTSKPQAPAPRYYQNTSKPQAPTLRYYQNKPLPVSAPRRSYTPNPEPKPVYSSKTYNKNPNSNRNRSEDGRPICFKCNKPGHVARYCRVRIGICEALIDTGADLSVVDLSTALNTGLEIINPDKMCSGPDGKELDIVGNIILNIKFDDKTITHQFVIMRTHLRIFILGRDFLKKMNAKIDCQREIIKYDLTENRDVIKYQQKKIKSAKDAIIPELSIKLINAFVEAEDGEYIIEENHKMFQTNGLRLARSLINVVNKETYIWITNPYPRPLKILKNQTLCFGSQPAEVNLMEESEQKEHEEPQFQINENLAYTEKEQLKQVLERYEDLFSSGLGRSNLAKHRIDTESAKPIKHKPYRVSAKEREIIKEQIDEMLRDGIIRPSSSPWSFPVILVKKRDSKYRFCVDYRKLNDVTVKDVYPIPRIDEVLDTLQGSKYFSAIDLKSGYWQVEVEEKDKEKTAFTTAHGLYEFNVMPFGLCNAPATFERNMENMLGNLRWQICLCYLDDVIIYSSDFSTHLKRIEAVLKCFREANLKLNNKKCQFAFEELEILGHITNQHGIKPAEHNIKAIRDFPRPKKIKEVQSFLGMCSYYRKFIKGFSKIADPLTSLIKKNVPFTWTENQEKAFQTLKVALINPPILGHFDPNAITYIHTDASNIGLGATLVQKFGDKEKVISYLSRTLSKPEQNYSTTEKECLAVVWSMSKLRPYLYGRHFKIVTDHHALCWLKNLKDPTGRLARWALKIQEYNFEIIHKSGKKHLDADGLSRGPLPENEWDEDYERLFLNQIIDEKDDFIENIKENLSGNKRSITQNFKEENGCLYKKNPNPEGRAWLLVVPKKRRKEVMSEYHNHMLNGHLGVARTTYRLKNKYYWPSMLKDVSEFVKTCHLCQSRKGSNHLPSGLLQPIPPANYPFERIGIDFVGPLPSTKRRRKWIIVLTDYYTKYAETKAVSEATVKEVSTFLIEHIILRHGAPRFLISDRGSQFTSNLMKEEMKMCKVKHCFTTSYHPQTNGLTERLNRTLINMISMYVNTDQKNWDEILPFITHAYNTTIQETTGYSPFFLLFGREPMSLLDDENIPTDSNMDDYDEYIENYLDKIARTRQVVINNTEKTQERMKRNYDKKHNEKIYEPGHLVAVWTPVRKIGKCEKLLRKYFGPYQILKKLSNVNYLIEPKDNPGQDPLIVHVSRLKPYFERIDEVTHEDVTTSGEGEVLFLDYHHLYLGWLKHALVRCKTQHRRESRLKSLPSRNLVQQYVDDVLRPVTLPYLQGVPNALYQQDNARPHTARISQQALQDVQMLPWPQYSPDLSPIEHVWDIIGRRLHALPQPRSEDELWQMVEREWRVIPQDAIRTLIDSLPRRVAACIAVRGVTQPLPIQSPDEKGGGGAVTTSLKNLGSAGPADSTLVRGEEFVKNVKEKIDGNPGKSMRAIAKEMDVGSMTIVRTIHEDLGLKSYALRKGQLLTENMKNNRKGKAAALLNNLKHDSFGMLRFFSDEKNFDVDQKVNPRNDRWICKDPSEIPVVMHTKFPASVMVLGVISSEGDLMPPHFFEKGLRMNADTYINVLETVVKPWMDMVAAGRKYVFQQDSAPAHKAKKTQSWLTLNVPSHWGPDIWPPNSPDCNPLDYYVWGVVERDVNKAPHTTIQSVKKAVHTVMTQMDK